jgi:hypothetical protein
VTVHADARFNASRRALLGRTAAGGLYTRHHDIAKTTDDVNPTTLGAMRRMTPGAITHQPAVLRQQVVPQHRDVS